MTSFRTPLAQAFILISVAWIGFWLFICALLLFIFSTMENEKSSMFILALANIFAFLILGSPAWLLLFIARFLLRLEKTRSEADKQTEHVYGIADTSQTARLASEVTADNIVPDTTRSKAGQVYLIQSDRGHYKIGMTKNIDDRMATFHVKLPFEPDLIHVIECEDRRATEKALHIKFAAKRINGEWFDLTGTDVAFIKSIKKA